MHLDVEANHSESDNVNDEKMSKRGKEMLRKAQACNEANTGFPKIALFMLNRAIEYRQLVGETYKHFPMYDKVDKASEDTHDQEIKDLTKVRAKLAEGEQRHPLRQNEQLAFEDAKIKAEVSKKVANARTELIDLLKINEVVAKKRSKLSDDKPHVPSTGKQVADSTGCLLKVITTPALDQRSQLTLAIH